MEKQALTHAMTQGKADYFSECQATYGATQYERWQREQFPYPVEWANAFEPFLVLNSSENYPFYDERFAGYGWDKISYSALLRGHGYRLMVDPSLFVVHVAHPKSTGGSGDGSDCLSKVMAFYIREMSAKFNQNLKFNVYGWTCND